MRWRSQAFLRLSSLSTIPACTTMGCQGRCGQIQPPTSKVQDALHPRYFVDDAVLGASNPSFSAALMEVSSSGLSEASARHCRTRCSASRFRQHNASGDCLADLLLQCKLDPVKIHRCNAVWGRPSLCVYACLLGVCPVSCLGFAAHVWTRAPFGVQTASAQHKPELSSNHSREC